MKVPESSSLIESFDNGEFATITSFKLEPEDMRRMIREYQFEPVSGYRPALFCIGDLKKERPTEGQMTGYYFRLKSNKEVHSNYVIDTTRRILWASISYPDWGGR